MRAEPLRFHDIVAWPLTRGPGQPSAYKMIYPPSRSEPQPTSHEGFEWVYVLSGRLRLVLGEQDFTMASGEAAELSTRIRTGWAAQATARSRPSCCSAARVSGCTCAHAVGSRTVATRTHPACPSKR